MMENNIPFLLFLLFLRHLQVELAITRASTPREGEHLLLLFLLPPLFLTIILSLLPFVIGSRRLCRLCLLPLSLI